jgi:hypothetical protein
MRRIDRTLRACRLSVLLVVMCVVHRISSRTNCLSAWTIAA